MKTKHIYRKVGQVRPVWCEYWPNSTTRTSCTTCCTTMLVAGQQRTCCSWLWTNRHWVYHRNRGRLTDDCPSPNIYEGYDVISAAFSFPARCDSYRQTYIHLDCLLAHTILRQCCSILLWTTYSRLVCSCNHGVKNNKLQFVSVLHGCDWLSILWSLPILEHWQTRLFKSRSSFISDPPIRFVLGYLTLRANSRLKAILLIL